MADARTSEKDWSVQSLRGLAVILMVTGHVIGVDPTSGLEVGDDSVWRFVYRALEDLRMPLFTVLSGYVYALRPVRDSSGLPGFLRGKFRRLVIPFVVVGTLTFIAKVLVPSGTNQPELSDLWRAYVYGVDQLWFLQSLALIFLVVGILDSARLLDSSRGWRTAFLVGCALHALPHLPGDWNVLNINGAFRLAPFFLLGYRFCRHPQTVSRWLLQIAALGFAATYAVRITTIAGDTLTLRAIPDRTIGLLVGVSGLFLVWSARSHIRHDLLVRIAPYSFGIYLLHMMAIWGLQRVTEELTLTATVAVFALSLVAGIVLPILFERYAGRYASVRLLILGERPRTESVNLRRRPGLGLRVLERGAKALRLQRAEG